MNGATVSGEQLAASGKSAQPSFDLAAHPSPLTPHRTSCS